MANPIGITFLPSDENQALGPKRGQLEGDLGQAFKILSLRLPRVQGARAIAPPNLLASQGSAGVPGQLGGGFNPQAAVFEALLKAMAGGPTSGVGPGNQMPMRPPSPRLIVNNPIQQAYNGPSALDPAPVPRPRRLVQREY
jgi:hypothetical protein